MRDRDLNMEQRPLRGSVTQRRNSFHGNQRQVPKNRPEGRPGQRARLPTARGRSSRCGPRRPPVLGFTAGPQRCEVPRGRRAWLWPRCSGRGRLCPRGRHTALRSLQGAPVRPPPPPAGGGLMGGHGARLTSRSQRRPHNASLTHRKPCTPTCRGALPPCQPPPTALLPAGLAASGWSRERPARWRRARGRRGAWLSLCPGAPGRRSLARGRKRPFRSPATPRVTAGVSSR